MYDRKKCCWIVIGFVALTPLLLWLAIQAETNTQDVSTWLPNGTSERASYDEFVSLFGQDDSVLVSWTGCRLNDPRLHQLTERLHRLNEKNSHYIGILDGATLLKELSRNQLGLSESSVRRRLANIYLGPDGETTGIVLQLSTLGQVDRKATLESLLGEVDQVSGLDRESIFLGGNSFICAEIDRSTNESLMLGFPSAILCLLITLLCLRSWRLTLITLSVAGFAALASVSMVTALGFKINGLLVLMPLLVLVLSLSGCIHLCSYFRTNFDEDPEATDLELAKRAVVLGWRPTSMAMLTTSLGILMLSSSRIEAVRHFGIFSALSISIALIILLVLYPALLVIWPAAPKEKEGWQRKRLRRSIDSGSTAVWSFRKWVGRFSLFLIVTLGVVGVLGLGKLETTLAPTKMFPETSRVNRGHQWISEHWTALESVELILQFPIEQGAMVDQLDSLTRIQGSLRDLETVCSSFSIANLSPAIPGKKSFSSIAERQTLNRKMREYRSDLMEQRLMAEDEASRYWRIHLGVSRSEKNFQSIMQEIQIRVDQTSAKLEMSPKAFLTGIWPLSAAGRQQQFDDLAFSFLMAFALITPLVMLVLRGFWVGLVAMIPNVFPALVFFGLLGWLGLRIDIGTILTASVGMGIAVDDTLHFLEWYSRERKRDLSSVSAVQSTIAQCARPMFFTTLICSSGLVLMVFSEFIPPRHFVFAIVALLSLALLCDLLLLPALIIGPLGFVFERLTESKESNPKQVVS